MCPVGYQMHQVKLLAMVLFIVIGFYGLVFCVQVAKGADLKDDMYRCKQNPFLIATVCDCDGSKTADLEVEKRKLAHSFEDNSLKVEVKENGEFLALLFGYFSVLIGLMPKRGSLLTEVPVSFTIFVLLMDSAFVMSDQTVKNPTDCFKSCVKDKLNGNESSAYAKLVTLAPDLCSAGLREFAICLEGCYSAKPARQMKRNIDYICSNQKDYEKIPHCYSTNDAELKLECFHYYEAIAHVKESGVYVPSPQCEEKKCMSTKEKCLDYYAAIFECPANYLRSECGIESKVYEFHLAIISFLTNAEAYPLNEKEAPYYCDIMTQKANRKFVASEESEGSAGTSLRVELLFLLLGSMIIMRLTTRNALLLLCWLAIVSLGMPNEAIADNSTMIPDNTSNIHDVCPRKIACHPEPCESELQSVSNGHLLGKTSETSVREKFCKNYKILLDCEQEKCCYALPISDHVQSVCKGLNVWDGSSDNGSSQLSDKAMLLVTVNGLFLLGHLLKTTLAFK